jgi:protein-S-isoprenylcysteine O-methyltransferase Ste14
VSATLVAFIGWIALMPLDARRFHWLPLQSPTLEVLGGALLPVSSFLVFRDNTFLSPLVRIQEDRRQHVVSSGVYAFVRHPMYLGIVFMFVGAPLLLRSGIGVLVGGGLTLLLVGRIVGEERLLVAQLEGYVEYRQKVRYRLVPFVW